MAAAPTTAAVGGEGSGVANSHSNGDGDGEEGHVEEKTANREVYSLFEVYEGGYHKDQKHGKGKFIASTGVVTLGRWEHGRLLL